MSFASHAYLLTAIVTILALILYAYMGGRTGSARGKYNIKAPAVTGDPLFERTYRVQMNTLEALPFFLPALWLATIYPSGVPYLAAALGLLWIIGRIVYMQSYIADPEKRSLGFGISLLAQVALMISAIVGVAKAWSMG